MVYTFTKQSEGPSVQSRGDTQISLGLCEEQKSAKSKQMQLPAVVAAKHSFSGNTEWIRSYVALF